MTVSERLRTGVLENEHVRLEYALDAGPRIVHFSRRGGRNVFAETPGIEWETVHGRPFRLLGGHRLWSAPECPLEEQVPDDEPVAVRATDGGVELAGATRTHDGLARRIELRLDGPRVHVTHTLVNDTEREVEAAAWALTQLAPGGVAVLPLPEAGAEQLPNRNVVLWPYSDVHDRRFEVRATAIRVATDDGPGFFKVGCLNLNGAVSYELGDVVFRKRFDPEPGAPHVDLGCNAEVYVRAEFLELETLTPLRRVGAGEELRHLEEWELLDAP